MNGAWHRLRLMVAQGVATLVGAEYVQVTVLDDETLPKVRRVEPFGLSSRPKPGAQVYMVFPSGDRAHGIALVIGDKRYQMDLIEGEVALHDDDGNFVKLGAGGVVTVKANTKVVAETPLFEVTGDVHIGGGLTVSGAAAFAAAVDVTGALSQGGKSVGASHKHTSTTPGTPTSGVN
jgi:phage baseplate assembly protein V